MTSDSMQLTWAAFPPSSCRKSRNSSTTRCSTSPPRTKISVQPSKSSATASQVSNEVWLKVRKVSPLFLLVHLFLIF